MVGEDIYALYADIKDLLDDICGFLSEEVQNGTLSSTSRSNANSLIDRSKTQLQELTNIIPNDIDRGGYVEMNSTRNNYVHDSGLQGEIIHPVVDEKPVCPYLDVPADGIQEKHGQLVRRVKYLLFGRRKKYFVGIYNNWLLVYYSSRESKPFETYNLKMHEAKLVEKRNNNFELISKVSLDSCVYTALTPKDAAQWVSAINRISHLPEAPLNEILCNSDETLYEVPNVKLNSVDTSSEMQYDTIQTARSLYDTIQQANYGETLYDRVNPPAETCTVNSMQTANVEETYDMIPENITSIVGELKKRSIKNVLFAPDKAKVSITPSSSHKRTFCPRQY